jgi:hypothetical protein
MRGVVCGRRPFPFRVRTRNSALRASALCRRASDVSCSRVLGDTCDGCAPLFSPSPALSDGPATITPARFVPRPSIRARVNKAYQRHNAKHFVHTLAARSLDRYAAELLRAPPSLSLSLSVSLKMYILGMCARSLASH